MDLSSMKCIADSSSIFLCCVCILIWHHAEQVRSFTSPAACCWALGFDQHGLLQRITCITHMYTHRGWQRMHTSELQWKYMCTSSLDKDNMEHFTKIYAVSVLQVFLRVVDPLERLLDSSRCSDLGLLRRDLVRGRGFTRPCSSISACCFLRRYSCLISSRRAFSSSLRMRSSSALRLEVNKTSRINFPLNKETSLQTHLQT